MSAYSQINKPVCPVCEREIKRDGPCRLLRCAGCAIQYWLDYDVTLLDVDGVVKLAESGVLLGCEQIVSEQRERISKAFDELFAKTVDTLIIREPNADIHH